MEGLARAVGTALAPITTVIWREVASAIVGSTWATGRPDVVALATVRATCRRATSDASTSAGPSSASAVSTTSCTAVSGPSQVTADHLRVLPSERTEKVDRLVRILQLFSQDLDLSFQLSDLLSLRVLILHRLV